MGLGLGAWRLGIVTVESGSCQSPSLGDLPWNLIGTFHCMHVVNLSRYLLVAAAVASCAAGVDLGVPAIPHRRVLFIGNSLTYFNNLPATVAAIARDNGDTIDVTMAAEPNLALIDHLNGMSAAPQLLRDSSWDVVVLQQGPTSTAVCRDSMVLWTGMIQPLIQRAGGASMTLMTWPAMSQGDVWEPVHTTAVLAAASVHGVLAPAGDAWHLALVSHPGLELYSKDGYHPSEIGSFLTALVVYQRLTGRDPRSLAPHGFSNGVAWPVLDAETFGWLAAAAAAANAATPANPVAPNPVPPAAPRDPGAKSC